MRTIQFVKDKDKIIRKAKETMEIYAPLADRMGMNRIRDELEDLSFSVLNKPARDLILERLNFIKNNTDDTFKFISQELIKILRDNGITATITGREKTPFSIWRKIQNKKISLEQLTDIIGFRVIVNNIEDCYKTLGIFHSRYSTIPGKFKDYISTPKINKYKSIHTAVIGPKKNRIEIQIRTHDMNEFAQRGIASHWKYKSSEKFSELSWKEYDWLRDLVEIIEAGTSPEHYYEFTKLQMFQENVFCFTPKGAVIKLPQKATPIDFAYAVHTKIGNNAIGCTINGRQATFQTILKNGDLVNIETSKNASPSLHWLSSSTTGKARSAIRRYWQDKSTENKNTTVKNYSSTIEIDLPHKPGVLGHITSLIGLNKGNIVNLEILKRKKDHLKFSIDLQIKDLKNFTNLISQIKQSNLTFKIIRHKQKKNAFIKRIFENFKRN
jgi:GTP pyrophosphokinase/guanosine-3',5'-bis(diphosphate) 3'-pyrophosphohydrolase